MSHRTEISKDTLDEKLRDIKPLTSVFDLVNTHIVVTDVHGNILYMNKAAQISTGYSEEESLGKNPGDLWGGNEDEEFFKKMWNTIKNEKKSFVGRVKNIRKDQTEIFQQLNITPILDDDGDIKYFVAIETNITDEMEKLDDLQHRVKVLMNSMVNREQRMTKLKEEIASLNVVE